VDCFVHHLTYVRQVAVLLTFTASYSSGTIAVSVTEAANLQQQQFFCQLSWTQE